MIKPAAFATRSLAGFTLAELLISLLIIGEIATFTIPKILLAQQNQRYNAIAREAVAAVSGAFTAYKFQNSSVPDTLTSYDLAPYFNYIKIQTTPDIDTIPGGTNYVCSNGAVKCLLLANGSVLAGDIYFSFGGSTPNRYISFYFDPDGQYSGNMTGPGKSVVIDLYHNGRVSIGGRAADSTIHDTGNGWDDVGVPDFTLPEWFHW